ncbi:hypothetical protein GmHk_11G032829 [Glycine max]|nr:hypothetical protein GmHk_11G032829 [Glycine max]
MHLGNTTTNRCENSKFLLSGVESAHWVLKRLLQNSLADLCSVWEAMNNMIMLQHTEIKASFETSTHVVAHRLLGMVSRYALNQIVAKFERVHYAGKSPSHCGCNPYVVGTLYKVHLQLVHTTPNSRLYGSNLVNIARFTSACGGLQPILDHLQSEGVYTFLMGLNENFLNVRGQILLMGPLPSINQHRQVDNSSLPTESQMACAVQAAKGKFTKKEIPTCSHCGVLGHIKEKCYKIHSYPPSYSKKGPRTKHVAVVNHVVDQQNTGAHDANGSSSLSSQQYQMMMQFIQAQMAKVASVDSDQSSNFCLGMSSNRSTWIFDSGASSHICCDLSMFNSFTYLHDKHVTFPNKTQVFLSAIGSITLSPTLKL